MDLHEQERPEYPKKVRTRPRTVPVFASVGSWPALFLRETADHGPQEVRCLIPVLLYLRNPQYRDIEFRQRLTFERNSSEFLLLQADFASQLLLKLRGSLGESLLYLTYGLEFCGNVGLPKTIHL